MQVSLLQLSIPDPKFTNEGRKEKNMADTALELRSEMTKDGKLVLSLAEVSIPEPAEDEVLVRVEASPINPSDLGLFTRHG